MFPEKIRAPKAVIVGHGLFHRVGTAMYDLHAHRLPSIDDGAADLKSSLTMERAFALRGVVACTPYVTPEVPKLGPQNEVGCNFAAAGASMTPALRRIGPWC